MACAQVSGFDCQGLDCRSITRTFLAFADSTAGREWCSAQVQAFIYGRDGIGNCCGFIRHIVRSCYMIRRTRCLFVFVHVRIIIHMLILGLISGGRIHLTRWAAGLCENENSDERYCDKWL